MTGPLKQPAFALRWVLGIAGVQLLLHVATNGNYGIFRDELYYLDCARHLDWGYVDHPGLSIWLLSLTTAVFGDSVHAIRLLSQLAGAGVIVLVALIARAGGTAPGRGGRPVSWSCGSSERCCSPCPWPSRS